MKRDSENNQPDDSERHYVLLWGLISNNFTSRTIKYYSKGKIKVNGGTVPRYYSKSTSNAYHWLAFHSAPVTADMRKAKFFSIPAKFP